MSVFKNTMFVIALALAVCLVPATAKATIITSFVSGDSSLSGNGADSGESVFVPSSGPVPLSLVGTTNINPHNAWSPNPVANGAQWVSYANTGVGPDGVTAVITAPNTTVTGTPTAVFLQEFNLPTGSYSHTGWVAVGADDTAAVWFNDVLMFSANPNQDGACADGPIACEVGEILNITLSGFLTGGLNTLRIEGFQIADGPFGVVWYGEVSSASTPGAIPEPSTYALMGLGLAGLALFRRHQSKKRVV